MDPGPTGPGPRAFMGRAEHQQFSKPSHSGGPKPPSQPVPRGRDEPFGATPHRDVCFQVSKQSIQDETLCKKLKDLSIEVALGNQKEGDHNKSVNPNFLPLKTILTSPLHFGTVN